MIAKWWPLMEEEILAVTYAAFKSSFEKKASKRKFRLEQESNA